MATETNDTPIILGNRCTIDNAQELCDALLTRAKHGEGDVTIDSQAVESVDVATLQVLWSAIKTLKNNGRKLTFKGSSPVFQKALEETGLVDYQN